MLSPFGILYNPVSIYDALHWICGEKNFEEDHLFEHQGLWHSFFHHGSFSGEKKADVLKNILSSIDRSRQFLNHADLFICTLGTAYVFERKDNETVVANCHKLPNSDFNRRKLSHTEILN